MRILLMLLLLSLSILTVFGQEKHIIEIEQERCHGIDSNQTTAGMMKCEAIARDAWDKEMNKYYKLLMSVLKTEEKNKLQFSQRQWINYRDAELDFSGTMYYNMQGTMWRVVSVGRMSDINKSRALELKTYYETITYDGK